MPTLLLAFSLSNAHIFVIISGYYLKLRDASASINYFAMLLEIKNACDRSVLYAGITQDEVDFHVGSIYLK